MTPGSASCQGLGGITSGCGRRGRGPQKAQAAAIPHLDDADVVSPGRWQVTGGENCTSDRGNGQEGQGTRSCGCSGGGEAAARALHLPEGSKTPRALPQAAQNLQEHGSDNTRPQFSLPKGFGKAPSGSTHPAHLLRANPQLQEHPFPSLPHTPAFSFSKAAAREIRPKQSPFPSTFNNNNNKKLKYLFLRHII